MIAQVVDSCKNVATVLHLPSIPAERLGNGDTKVELCRKTSASKDFLIELVEIGDEKGPSELSAPPRGAPPRGFLEASVGPSSKQPVGGAGKFHISINSV